MARSHSVQAFCRFALAVAFMVVGAVCAAEASWAQTQVSPAGVWRTFGPDGKPRALVRIEVSGTAEVSGRLIDTLVPGEDRGRLCTECDGERHNKPILGMQILGELKRDARYPNVWSGGWVLDPEEGDIYRVKLTLSPDGRQLSVRGFVAVELIGETRVWKREEASSATSSLDAAAQAKPKP